MRVFKLIYWAAVIVLPAMLLLVGPDEHLDVLLNKMTVILYMIAAGGLYRFLLLIAWHATDSDAVDKEIRDSEGRVELNLSNRKR